MSKQVLFLVTGLSLAISSAGCCCSHWGANKCGCGCPPGAAGGGGYYSPPPQTGMYQSADPNQLAFSSTTSTAYAGGITTTAAAPAPIMGTPIYNAPPGTYTATTVPTASLPTYH